MSEVRVNNIVDYGGKGAPTFDNGAVISGVSSLGNQAKIGSNVTITSGGINVSGVTTAATLSGNLTGDVSAGFLTATSTVIGSGVTINAGGLNITGVVTATTFEGSGASMTGVAMTITPLSYNPDVNDSAVTAGTGIGITFDHRILAGSGNVTLSVATNAGAAGTTVENFGVGSSVTIAGRKATINPASDLDYGETYHISYPSGAFTNTGGDVSYVGTAYTFGVKPWVGYLRVAGENENGNLGQNSVVDYSSPTQIPGANWLKTSGDGSLGSFGIKSDGTLWAWGYNYGGALGLNYYAAPGNNGISSPTQLPGTTWKDVSSVYYNTLAVKTDGTLWSWGYNDDGNLGLNNRTAYSSPVQIPGTNWNKVAGLKNASMATKTDGTLWSWGNNQWGYLGQNNRTKYSSPIQIPGTTWDTPNAGWDFASATKTDGTLWSWGYGNYGHLGHNNRTNYSSPVQVPGTTWSSVQIRKGYFGAGLKTDGTMWAWGYNGGGYLGQNNTIMYSSPVQVGSDTTWSSIGVGGEHITALKTDGTAWSCGSNQNGNLGQNNTTRYSSPVQVPGTDYVHIEAGNQQTFWIRES